jgi:hypothetical protein
MNTQAVSILVIQRHIALNKYKSATTDYIENMTKENYETMQLLQRYYQSFQRKIYTHDNIIEMIELLKESAEDKIILDELDGYVVSLVVSRNKMPMLTVKALEDQKTVKSPIKRLKEMTDDEISKLKPIQLKALKTMDKLENE